MKRLFLLCSAFLVLMFSGCSGPYKRISFQGEALGDNETIKKIQDAEIVYSAKETFDETIPIYRIIPRQISIDDFRKLAKAFGVNEEPMEHNGGVFIRSKETYKGNASKQFILHEPNEISASFHSASRMIEFDWTEDRTERTAREIFQRLSFLKDEFEYLGISSTRTVATSQGTFIQTVRVSFRRLLDGTRVIGNDICDMYFDCIGLKGIELRLFDYEKIGEMDLIPLEKAKTRIKTPDSYSTSSEKNNVLSGECDVLEIERVKLLFVNQYAKGCEILQPVYNFIGHMKNDTESCDFQSRVIAIPEKYTHD